MLSDANKKSKKTNKNLPKYTPQTVIFGLLVYDKMI